MISCGSTGLSIGASSLSRSLRSCHIAHLSPRRFFAVCQEGPEFRHCCSVKWLKGAVSERYRLSAHARASEPMVSHPEESGPGLFVYGTLMDEEILKLLIGRVPKMSDATVTGFRRYALTGRAYPGTVVEDGASVTGKLLLELSSNEMDILDEYEDEDYDRVEATAIARPGPESSVTMGEYKVAIYVWKHKDMCKGEWSYDDFVKRDKQRYVEMVTHFVQEDLPHLLEARRTNSSARGAHKTYLADKREW